MGCAPAFSTRDASAIRSSDALVRYLDTHAIWDDARNHILAIICRYDCYDVEFLKQMMIKYPFMPYADTYHKRISVDIAAEITTPAQVVKWMIILNQLTETQLYTVLFPYKYKIQIGQHYLHLPQYGVEYNLSGAFAYALLNMLIDKQYMDLFYQVVIDKKYRLSFAQADTIITTMLLTNISEDNCRKLYNTAPILRDTTIMGKFINYILQHNYITVYVYILQKGNSEFLRAQTIAETLEEFIRLNRDEQNCMNLLKSHLLTHPHILRLLNYAIDAKYYNTIEAIIKLVIQKNNYTLLRDVYDKVPGDPITLKLFQLHDKCYIGDHQEEGSSS